ncbi:hypothetical protein FA13DRAFT_1736167 [Coprinellus micaceus]|uniref:Uncharacterized protein n=1 Tax=Coprinellus micaceus TaxID=71717 RepID=A0A4Y7T1Z7_COPMI|nr:hypothetical protein FA13DRAFT_1736167 [Coprinellus micaceus]
MLRHYCPLSLTGACSIPVNRLNRCCHGQRGVLSAHASEALLAGGRSDSNKIQISGWTIENRLLYLRKFPVASHFSFTNRLAIVTIPSDDWTLMNEDHASCHAIENWPSPVYPRRPVRIPPIERLSAESLP